MPTCDASARVEFLQLFAMVNEVELPNEGVLALALQKCSSPRADHCRHRAVARARASARSAHMGMAVCFELRPRRHIAVRSLAQSRPR